MNQDQHRPRRPDLLAALKRYWANLVGLAACPTLFFVGDTFFNIPFTVFLPIFFAAGAFAAWPCITGNAPYSFWIVGCGIWMGGGVIAMAVVTAIGMFFG